MAYSDPDAPAGRGSTDGQAPQPAGSAGGAADPGRNPEAGGAPTPGNGRSGAATRKRRRLRGVIIFFITATAFLLFNPVLVIFVCAVVSLRYHLPRAWLIPALAVSLLVSNREYGVTWGEEHSFGQDDAPAYMERYRSIQATGLLKTLVTYQEEPLLLTLYKGLACVSAGETVVLFISVFVPVTMLFYVFSRHSRFPYLMLAILLGLFPGWWNIVFHLFRLSLGFPFLAAMVIAIYMGNGKRWIYPILSVLSHVTLLYAVLPVQLYSVFQNACKRFYILCVLIITLTPVLCVPTLLTKFDFIDRVAVYSNEYGILRLSGISVIYIAMAGYFVYRFRDNILGITSSVVLSGYLLVFLSGSIVAERILVFTNPLLAIPLYFAGERKRLFRLLILAMVVLYYGMNEVRYSAELQEPPRNVFYFMAMGNFYNPLAGVLFNTVGR